jgi:UDP-N-acetylglucosamine 2-epimerase (non-hydrolysing)
VTRSSRPRILSIIGTRPEAVKMAPVVRRFHASLDRFEHRLVTTGQHRSMPQQMLAAFGLRPDIDLALGEPNQNVAEFAARALAATSELLERERPDAVLVQGDTSTVMAVSIAAFYARVRVGHVEAGLRSFDRDNPFPEEINRRITSVVADWHFAPTERARRNLLAEGIADDTIHVTGNTVVDALAQTWFDGASPEVLASIGDDRRVVLVTAHRRESFGEPMRAICRAIRSIVEERSDVDVVFPVHPNPSVRDVVREALDGVGRVHLIEPMTYEDLLATMKRSVLVLTDSGGIQEEAPCIGTPVLVLRSVTERPELIESGGGILVGTSEEAIRRETLRLLDDDAARQAMRDAPNPFGDGRAAERIVEILARSYGLPSREP